MKSKLSFKLIFRYSLYQPRWAIWRNFLHFVSYLLVEATTFVERSLWIVFHQVGGLQNEQSLLLTQTCFNCKRKWFVGLFECFFGQVPSKVMWTNGSLTQKPCFSRSIWSLLFDVNEFLSQKCRSRFSKANFYSKTVCSVFSVFVLHSTSFPIKLINIVWC